MSRDPLRSRSRSGKRMGWLLRALLRDKRARCGAIPIDESQHPRLRDLGIWARYVSDGIDAALIVLSKPAIFVIRRIPHLDQPCKIVIDALDRILVHDPLRSDHRLLGSRG